MSNSTLKSFRTVRVGINFISYFAARMSDTLAANSIQDGGSAKPFQASQFLVGGVVGGITLSLVSAAGTFALEKEVPTPKTLSRDFILGSILFLMIMQLLPESTGKIISLIMSLVVIPKVLSTSLPDIKELVNDEIEVKVGVPRF
jgi:hypothetical protein